VIEFAIVLISILVFISSIFILIHLRPLTQDEIKKVVDKRRNNKIREYYSYDKNEYSINKDFKKRMKPDGKLYQHNEKLFDFPSTASALLKYKKHEWIIIAFEKNKHITSFWVNKGFDRSSVSAQLSAEEIAELAKNDNYTSILIFHNHPNSNPNHYDCSNPSDQDIKSANIYASVLNKSGLNLIEFICERGSHHEYYLSPSNTFYPVLSIISAIDKVNNISKIKNLILHIERIF